MSLTVAEKNILISLLKVPVPALKIRPKDPKEGNDNELFIVSKTAFRQPIQSGAIAK